MPLPRQGRIAKKVESSSENSSLEDEQPEAPKTFTMPSTEEKSQRKKKFELVADEAEEDAEDEPVGVIRASQQNEKKPTLDLEQGTIKNLAHMFQSITELKEPPSRQPFKMDLDENESEIVLESTPVEQSEGVARAADPSEWQKPIDVQRGATRNLASQFLNKTMEVSQVKKKPFKMDLDENAESIVLENEPVVLEGVVRSSEKQEEPTSQRGRIKSLAKGFVSLAQDESQDVEREKGPTTRTVSQRWKNSQAGSEDGERVRERIQLDAASEFGVYENEPEVRNDVARAGEEQPDVIHVKHTRNLKKMWCQFEKSELEKEQNSKKPELRVKRERTPPPPPPPKEPTPPPKEEPKKKSWAGRKKEADKTPTSPISPEANNFQKSSLKTTARRRF